MSISIAFVRVAFKRHGVKGRNQGQWKWVGDKRRDFNYLPGWAQKVAIEWVMVGVGVVWLGCVVV